MTRLGRRNPECPTEITYPAAIDGGWPRGIPGGLSQLARRRRAFECHGEPTCRIEQRSRWISSIAPSRQACGQAHRGYWQTGMVEVDFRHAFLPPAEPAESALLGIGAASKAQSRPKPPCRLVGEVGGDFRLIAIGCMVLLLGQAIQRRGGACHIGDQVSISDRVRANPALGMGCDRKFSADRLSARRVRSCGSLAPC